MAAGRAYGDAARSTGCSCVRMARETVRCSYSRSSIGRCVARPTRDSSSIKTGSSRSSLWSLVVFRAGSSRLERFESRIVSSATTEGRPCGSTVNRSVGGTGSSMVARVVGGTAVAHVRSMGRWSSGGLEWFEAIPNVSSISSGRNVTSVSVTRKCGRTREIGASRVSVRSGRCVVRCTAEVRSRSVMRASCVMRSSRVVRRYSGLVRTSSVNKVAPLERPSSMVG